MQCDVLLQVSLFKEKKKPEKAFLADKVLCGFTALFGISKYVTINIVLDKTEPQKTCLKKKNRRRKKPMKIKCKSSSPDSVKKFAKESS